MSEKALKDIAESTKYMTDPVPEEVILKRLAIIGKAPQLDISENGAHVQFRASKSNGQRAVLSYYNGELSGTALESQKPDPETGKRFQRVGINDPLIKDALSHPIPKEIFNTLSPQTTYPGDLQFDGTPNHEAAEEENDHEPG